MPDLRICHHIQRSFYDKLLVSKHLRFRRECKLRKASIRFVKPASLFGRPSSWNSAPAGQTYIKFYVGWTITIVCGKYAILVKNQTQTTRILHEDNVYLLLLRLLAHHGRCR